MKTKKDTHEVSIAINMKRLDATNHQFFKISTLPVWLAIAISIGLGFAKSVNAQNTGSEDVHRNYRYIKPEGVENKAGSSSQGTKESSTVKETGAKKTKQGDQTTTSGPSGSTGKANQTTQESSGKKDEEVKKSSQEQPAANSGKSGTMENAGQAVKESSGKKDEGAKNITPDEQAKNPNTNAGNTGSAASNLTPKESSREKCAGAEKQASGTQNTTSAGNSSSVEKVGQESKTSSATPAKPTSGEQNAQIAKEIESVKKPAEDKGKLPTFTQADKNGDHFVTKEELENFPYMLQTFDKVDAGKDGKLEQHEYQNLEMETKREAEIP
ncbi:MAG: hypothetical protein PHY16_14265 [Methylobacter sp.]|nr:hypothetical protein [Methylobacter sp.]